ncbi:unnamed protein product [Effrenium voratum]|uniref:Uncharacterized protein n=1 Tax=Effrenium voratum TaxID=2562239 RepID=A0AA36I3F4_9DINO|nr:unnamed protein product [Effrenium voratum]CAJ1447487.1 unnamed protein product [Effrenium voratum]
MAYRGVHFGHRAGNIVRWTVASVLGILSAILLFLHRYLATIFLVLFIYFILSFVLRAHTDPFPAPLRIIGGVGILLSTAFVTSLPWLLYGGKGACRASRGTSKTPWDLGFDEHWLDLSLRFVFLWPLAMLAIWVTLADHPPSAYVRQAVRCIIFAWFGKLIHTITVTVDSCVVPDYNDEGVRPLDSDSAYFSVFGNSTHFVADVWFLQLVVEQLVAFQAAYGESLQCTSGIVWLSRLMIPMVTMQAFGVISRVVALGNSIMLSLGVVSMCFLLCRAYMVPYNYLLKAQKLDVNNALSAELEKETTFAMRIIHKSQLGSLVGSCGMILAFLSFGLGDYILPKSKAWYLIWVVTSNVDSLGIMSSLVMQSGVKIKCRPRTGSTSEGGLKLFALNLERTATHCFNGAKDERAEEWQEKVADLALRRVSVEVLLHFFLQLGQEDAMPHFDTKKSTTNDVVRHMVIPNSRDGRMGRSFAEKFGPKASATPRMVTHHWSNRFCDLVAAVLADALDLKRWDVVAGRLRSSEGVEELKEALYAHGVLHWQYWICAFCINQHASICGTSMGIRDTVTQEVLPSCDCATPKYLNDQPVRCEMNKFDDMMAYLHRECPKFLQVVAIDVEFMIFSRAWCVAELVQADASHLEQHMMIHSPSALEKNSGRLKSIQVQDCSASREEDKLAILAKIGTEEDVDNFNHHLQQILLGNGGLLADWLDGQKLLQEVGAISARAKARVEEAAEPGVEMLDPSDVDV